MPSGRSIQVPDKLAEKVFVLVKYVKDGIFNVVELKEIRADGDIYEQGQCHALWKPNRVYYPAIIVKINENKQELQKLKTRIEKAEKKACNEEEGFHLFKFVNQKPTQSAGSCNEKRKLEAAAATKLANKKAKLDHGQQSTQSGSRAVPKSKKAKLDDRKAILNAQHQRKVKAALDIDVHRKANYLDSFVKENNEEVDHVFERIVGQGTKSVSPANPDDESQKMVRILSAHNQQKVSNKSKREESQSIDENWRPASGKKGEEVVKRYRKIDLTVFEDSDDDLDDEPPRDQMDSDFDEIQKECEECITLKRCNDELQESNDQLVQRLESLSKKYKALKADKACQLSTGIQIPGQSQSNNKSAVAGEYSDDAAARSLSLIPLLPGSHVYLSQGSLATAGNGVKSPSLLTYNLLRVFFPDKAVVCRSNYNGGGTAGYVALHKVITSAIIGYVKLKMPEVKTSLITAAINMYCTRIRNQMKDKAGADKKEPTI